MTEYFKIAGGTVYDPANGVDGAVRDIWIAGGKIALPPTDPEIKPVRVLDARGLVIMPGGIDMHCHIAGPKVNTARKMCPEQKRRGEPVRRTRITRSGTMGSVPSTFATGYKYAGMGYTTAFDAAIPPLSARHAHEELEDTPCIDKGFYILMVEDPWRVVMSTDHPNGGSFLAYPQIIRLLMDRTDRQDMLKAVPAKVRQQSVLAELDREYSLSEIVIITRAAPARILGLKHKGHLGPGADADITIYTPDANQETMFELPRHVIKAGRVIGEHGEIREETYGKTLHVAPEYDRDVEPDIQKWFEDSCSIQWRNYLVDIDAVHEHEVVSGIGSEAQDLK